MAFGGLVAELDRPDWSFRARPLGWSGHAQPGHAERISVAFGTRTLLDGVSLGLGRGDVVGVVGRNGDGKTTLLQVLTGVREPDSGRVLRTGATSIGYLRQAEDADTTATVRDVIVGGAPDHVWAAQAHTRAVVEHLLAGIDLDAPLRRLSGGERRRAGLAELLLPITTCWRWMSRSTTSTWRRWTGWPRSSPLADPRPGAAGGQPRPLVPGRDLYPDLGGGRRHRGGVRRRLRGVRAAGPNGRGRRPGRGRRRTRCARSWPGCAADRRPGPASRGPDRGGQHADRDEPPPRDRLELQQLATRRLGKDVFDLDRVNLTLPADRRAPLRDLTWSIGPGQRIGLVGVNGSGKTTAAAAAAGRAGAGHWAR